MGFCITFFDTRVYLKGFNEFEIIVSGSCRTPPQQKRNVATWNQDPVREVGQQCTTRIERIGSCS